MDKVRVALIGLGGMGTWGHLRGYEAIPDVAKLVTLCDKNPGTINEPARRHGAKTYSDFNQAISDPEVDMVDVCLPHYLHGRVALAAAKAGKHVICEKPFTTTLEEADAVIDAIKSAGVKLMVAENTPFIKAYEVAKKFLDGGAIGKVCIARSYLGGSEMIRLSDPDNWIGKKATAGGGVMFDAGVHSFYLMRWMVGEITSVQATVTTFRPDLYQDVEDNAIGNLRFANGAMGNFSLSNTTEVPWTEKFELLGTKGGIIVDMLAQRPVQIFSTEKRSDDMSDWWDWYGNVSWQEPFFHHSATQFRQDSVRAEIEHFVNCILENQEPRVSGKDGRRDVEISLKAYESVRLGKEVRV